MPFDEIKYRVVAGLVNIAGQVITRQISKPNREEYEKINREYYESAKAIIREDEKNRKPEQITQIQPTQEQTAPEPEIGLLKDMTAEKIEGGTACVACSSDHFSTASGALSEALRFARKEGVNHPEVIRRIGACKDELNIMERLDLSAENIVQLEGREKQLAEWALDKSRELRHKITAIQSPSDLERVAAEASEIRTRFMKEVWELAIEDGTLRDLCRGFEGDEYEHCISKVNDVLSKKRGAASG